MEALVLSVITIASISLAAGADNGVWKGDDDRPEYIHHPHYHEDDHHDYFDKHPYREDDDPYIHVHHYNEEAPMPVGLIIPQPGTSPPAASEMNMPRPVNVFDSGTLPLNKGLDPGPSHDNAFGHIAQIGDTATIIVHGDDEDPHYDAIEYETYSGPYHEHGRDHYYDEEPYHDHDHYYHDEHDDGDYHDYHEPHGADHYHEPVHHHIDRYIDDDELAERARESFDDEIEQETYHGDHDHYMHDAEPDIIVEHHSRPMPANAAIDNRGHVVDDHKHLADDNGHVVEDHIREIDDADMVDPEDFGNGHNVIELPSFTAPVAHNSKNNKAVVMIGDVTPATNS